MFNKVIITGRLTSDPELKTTNSGLSVCSFTIANETGYGENKKTNFINCVAWRKSAEVVAKYFTKGSLIGLEGSIQTRKYEDKDGKSHTATEIVASDIQFMEKKNDTTDKDGNPYTPSTSRSAPAEQFAPVADEDGLPF